MAVEHRLHARCGHHHEGAWESSSGAAGGRPFAFAHSPRHFERDRPFTIEHLALDLTLDFDKRSVRGTALLRVKRVDPKAHALVLDAVAFKLESVRVAGKDARYTYDGRVLTVEMPPSLDGGEVAVHYEATPRKGLYFLEPDEHVPDRPKQAWTQCQEEDGRHFFPCHDKPHVKMTTEARVRVPEGFYVLSNGELVSRDGGVFHWKMSEPHASYLMTIVAGEFAEVAEDVKVDGRSIPLTYLVPKGKEEDAKRTFGRTPEMIRHFSELTGVAYPWNKYAQVVVSDFFFGGMENTTATTMYEHILLDARAALDVTSDDLVAHELAHQWFGDFVTCRDWSEGWLNEGFATFMEHVWREKHLGRDEYEYGIKNDLASYLGEAHGRYRRPIVCQDYEAPLDLFDRHLYEKGGLVLHVLRTELGDELFWKGVRTYLERHAGGIVETRDLMRAFEQVSGRSLGRRFDELVYRPGHVELEIDLAWDDGVLTASVKQTQSTQDQVPAAYEVPLILEISESGEHWREKVKVTARADSFAIPCAERPDFVVVDPEMRILGEVTVKAPADMLRKQLAGAKTARGRWLAAHALAKSDDPVTIEALAARLHDDGEVWLVRAECAEALGRIKARECFEALKKALDVAHPKVRRAVAAALGSFRTTAAVELLKPKALRDASYVVEAEAARALGRTRQNAAFDTLIDVMDRPSWADVIAAGAIDGLAALRDDRALAHLYKRTRYGHSSRIRRAAALAIPKLTTDRRAREHLEDLLDDGDPILRMDIVRALSDLGDARSRGALRARVDVDLDARVRRRIKEALRDLGGEKKHQKQLEDDLEKLTNEHAELRSRLAKLEARILPEKNPAPKKAAAKDAKKSGKTALRPKGRSRSH
jgi:aminopeptidase N